MACLSGISRARILTAVAVCQALSGSWLTATGKGSVLKEKCSASKASCVCDIRNAVGSGKTLTAIATPTVLTNLSTAYKLSVNASAKTLAAATLARNTSVSAAGEPCEAYGSVLCPVNFNIYAMSRGFLDEDDYIDESGAIQEETT